MSRGTCSWRTVKAELELLAGLEGTPKEGGDFPRRLAELRKAFQQHVRDERRELLPAVRQALSAEEAQAVVERVEAGRAEAEEARREKAEERRAEARREREEAERRKAEAEKAEREEAEAAERAARETGAAVARSVEGAAQGGLRLVEAGGVAAEAGAELADRGSRQTTDLAGEAARRTTASASGTARRYGHAASAALRAEGDLVGLWLELAGEQAAGNAETLRRLAATRDWREALELQGGLVRASLERWSRLNGCYLGVVRAAMGSGAAGRADEAA